MFFEYVSVKSGEWKKKKNLIDQGIIYFQNSKYELMSTEHLPENIRLNKLGKWIEKNHTAWIFM